MPATAAQALAHQRISFREFIERVSPSYKFYRHLNNLIDVLQDVADDKRHRVMIFMPPRHGKSETISRLFSAYYLYRHPERWVGLSSYAAELAYTLSRAARDNYLEAGGILSDTATAVAHWETNAKGGMWAAGVGGPITGKGGHLLIIDDPLKNAEEAASDTVREKHKDWYRSTLLTREEPGGAIIVVQTRWHQDDLSGWLLSQENDEDVDPERWHIVSMEALKEIAQPKWPATCTIAEDDRQPGEALCPERYDAKKLQNRKSKLDAYFWSALYQQTPQPPEGTVFMRLWWQDGRNRYSINDRALVNQCLGRWISIDTAMSTKAGSAFSSFVVAELMPDYRLMIRHVHRERLQFPHLIETITRLASQHNQDEKLRGIIIEDKSSGTSAYQTLALTADDWIQSLLFAFQPHGDKVQRAKQAANWANRDSILLPHPDNACPWLLAFEEELFNFPVMQYKDQVDSFSQLVIYLENLLSAGWHAREGDMRQEQ